MRILMVHGRSQGGKDPQQLKAAWIAALKRGFGAAGRSWPADVEFDFPYYGDALDRLVIESRLPMPEDVIAKGLAGTGGFEVFMQSALDEIRENAGISDTEIRAHIDPGAPQQKGVQNWWWVRAIARAIDDRLTPVAGFTIEIFLRDVYLYLRSKEAAAEIDRIIDEKLTDAPTVVIAHSLGSVAAYQLIRRQRGILKLHGFVTVGSPLGLRAIASKLGLAENPAGKDAWCNAYDKRDIVSLNPLDEDHFPADPSVFNHGGVNNHTSNRHGIVGYLDDPVVAARIADAVDSMRSARHG